MITREQNLSTNIHRIHAEDADHPFNWFYQQLLDKEATKSKTKTHVQQTVVEEKNHSTQTELQDNGDRS